VRIAVGATVKDVRKIVFTEGMLPIAIGLTAGFDGLGRRQSHSAFPTRCRFSRRSPDARRRVRVAGSLCGIRLLRPGRRATTIDPAEVRHECGRIGNSQPSSVPNVDSFDTSSSCRAQPLAQECPFYAMP